MSATELMTPARRWLALQRLTALWAFCESGLGGVLHALKLPFTGLIVGSFSVICITLIAWCSERHYRRILDSLLLVLIIKAVVSPHAPPTAYVAVAFQGLAGYALYKTAGIRAGSIYTLAVIALLESALQKLLNMTLFFGKSFWAAADELVAFIGRELRIGLPPGSMVLVVVYVGLYLLGGVACGWMTNRLLRDLSGTGGRLPDYVPARRPVSETAAARRRKGYLVMTVLFVLICILVYFGAADQKSGSLALLRTLLWTGCALLLWYGLIAPLALHAIRRYLRKRQSAHSGQVQELLRLLPGMRRLSLAAWQQSRNRTGPARIPYFVRLLVHWTLVYDPGENERASA
ncbi:hypothetical protein EPD60_00385 [Flaviaesturariibacter flavus]|uniref:Uncharacterized protein n=1 Tax=Flaviaesturariibacter flavus TaxID=2502780 RepID=A0A4R1BQR2_9BACT|nr:hypothetical protein [Flaviaesturariibacter flavus]TCJ19616.1 hypothetical protein EPD60_00385 [Flaviaesturariibacter flavus]